MKDVVENEVIKELSEKYHKKEKLIRIMVEKCKSLGYNIQEAKGMIENFYQK